MNTEPSNLFPALRAEIGDRWYYVTTLTFAEVAKWFKQVDKIHERQELKTWIQRLLRPERTTEIATYLLTQKQRFFNAIVAGIYRGEPEWFPIEVNKSITLKDVRVGERQATAFGLLHISGYEDIFAIDGQHRVEGIKEALSQNDSLATEELAVIFVAHKSTDKGRERTRRLFTTLNKFAKPVSKAEQIALNDDDTFAIVTRGLIDNYPGLNGEFVPLSPTANIPAGNNKCITTVIALYDLIRTIALPTGSRERKKLELGPPNLDRVKDVHQISVAFWDALKRHVTPIRRVMLSKPENEIAGRFRKEGGGHALFRPVGMQSFAKAVRIIVDRGDKLERAVERLSVIPLQLTDEPWRGVLWNDSTKTMILKHARLAMNLFLHMAGEEPIPRTFDILARYREALGMPEKNLPKI